MVLMYPEATVRLNTLPYKLDDFQNQLIHVTNVYQQKNHPDYDPYAVLKWPFAKLGDYLANDLQIAPDDFLPNILIPRIRRILASVAQRTRKTTKNYPAVGDCFAVFGADLIIDAHLRPWLSEIQKGPGLSFDDPVKRHVIPPMLAEATDIALEIRDRRQRQLNFRISPACRNTIGSSMNLNRMSFRQKHMISTTHRCRSPRIPRTPSAKGRHDAATKLFH